MKSPGKLTQSEDGKKSQVPSWAEENIYTSHKSLRKNIHTAEKREWPFTGKSWVTEHGSPAHYVSKTKRNPLREENRMSLREDG